MRREIPVPIQIDPRLLAMPLDLGGTRGPFTPTLELHQHSMRYYLEDLKIWVSLHPEPESAVSLVAGDPSHMHVIYSSKGELIWVSFHPLRCLALDPKPHYAKLLTAARNQGLNFAVSLDLKNMTIYEITSDGQALIPTRSAELPRDLPEYSSSHSVTNRLQLVTQAAVTPDRVILATGTPHLPSQITLERFVDPTPLLHTPTKDTIENFLLTTHHHPK